MNQSIYRTALLRRTMAVLACGLPAAWAAPAMAASLRDAAGILRPVALIPVTGRVTGADGAGLPGVTVLVRGTSTGTSTAWQLQPHRARG